MRGVLIARLKTSDIDLEASTGITIFFSSVVVIFSFHHLLKTYCLVTGNETLCHSFYKHKNMERVERKKSEGESKMERTEAGSVLRIK